MWVETSTDDENHRAGDMGKLTITANEKKMNVSVALGKARVQV
jgi:hypothetical protein